MFLFIVKILVVVFFLVMFLRRANWVWGIGLLTVTTAVFFDTLVTVLGSDIISEQAGFFSYILYGLIVGGAALWLIGLLRPQILGPVAETIDTSRTRVAPQSVAHSGQLDDSRGLRRGASMTNEASAYDRQLIYDQVRHNLSPEDVLDLIFDLDMNENDVIAPGYDMSMIIINVMDLAQERGQMSDLALAVERILTPVPPDHFPRLDKITIETPSSILRRYMLTFYFLDQIEQMAKDLQVDWELLGLGSKQNKVRSLLLYLKRRNRLPELIELMRQPAESAPAAKE